MNTSIRTAIVAVVVSVLAVGVFGIRFVCVPADLSAIHRNAELEQLRTATYRRVDARQRVVREVIDRRLALAEAIERLQELDREWPDYSEAVPEVPAWGGGEERSYRYILAEVEEILRERPEQAAAVQHRLEKEYQQLRAGEPASSPTTVTQAEPNP